MGPQMTFSVRLGGKENLEITKYLLVLMKLVNKIKTYSIGKGWEEVAGEAGRRVNAEGPRAAEPRKGPEKCTPTGTENHKLAEARKNR